MHHILKQEFPEIMKIIAIIGLFGTFPKFNTNLSDTLLYNYSTTMAQYTVRS